MGIRPEEVRRVAELARLELRDDELERVAAELTAVLEYAAAIRRLEFEPDAAVAVPAGSALREDEPAPPLTADAALAMAPESEAGFFVVPAFVENVEP
jgi:aspartyl-tRNA(Asn)/glutamyl-tRNA(Gln) amidotransferase subunit C